MVGTAATVVILEPTSRHILTAAFILSCAMTVLRHPSNLPLERGAGRMSSTCLLRVRIESGSKKSVAAQDRSSDPRSPHVLVPAVRIESISSCDGSRALTAPDPQFNPEGQLRIAVSGWHLIGCEWKGEGG